MIILQFLNTRKNATFTFYRDFKGLDFGYANDPTAMSCIFDDEDKYEIFVYDEIYRTQLTNQRIRDNIRYKGYMNDVIIADNEDARTINELRLLGLNRIKAAKKGKGSVLAGIQKLQDYHIYVHPRCMNHVVEFSNYV